MSLVSSEIRQAIIDKEQGQQQSNEIALKLIESINSLLINGEYIDDLETNVKEIRTTYDALGTSEKNIVKNYSKLTQAESDLKKLQMFMRSMYLLLKAMKRLVKHGKMHMLSFPRN